VSRPVIPYLPTWLDKFFRKGLKGLTSQDQEAYEERLGDLLEALAECRHPIQDPNLRPWNPSSYRGVVKIKGGGHLAEYRFPPTTMRVIACYFIDRPEILLLAATINHDHPRMQRLIKEHGRSLNDYLT
jgi:hypothetical protein